jgi:hypothetical protein
VKDDAGQRPRGYGAAMSTRRRTGSVLQGEAEPGRAAADLDGGGVRTLDPQGGVRVQSGTDPGAVGG